MATRRPQDPQTPDESTPPPADETAPLEAPAPADPPPPAYEPVSGPPEWEAPPAGAAAAAWTPAAGAPPPGWGPTPRSAGPVRRAWAETRATQGGRVAVAAIGVLSVVLLVALIGLAAALVGDRGHGMVADGREGTSFGREEGQGGPGRGNGLGRQGRDGQGGTGMGRQDRDRQALPPGPQQGGNGQGNGPGGGTQRMPGMGVLGGFGGLGAVLHGEFTTGVTGAPAVMLVQSGQVTAYTAGASLAVRSTDGFSATYVVDASTITPGGSILTVGSTVRVLAAKQGMKAVLVVAGG